MQNECSEQHKKQECLKGSISKGKLQGNKRELVNDIYKGSNNASINTSVISFL